MLNNHLQDNDYPIYPWSPKIYCEDCGYERQKEEIRLCDNCMERNKALNLTNVAMVNSLFQYFKTKG